MAEEEEEKVDRWLSAVVKLKPAHERAPDEEPVTPETPRIDVPEGIHIAPAPGEAPREVKVPVSVAQVSRTKQFFTSSGFEVHAPVGATFSIGGKQSTFERFFGVELMVDESQMGSPVSTVSGDRHIALDALPDEFKAIVESVTFPPAVQIPGLKMEHGL